VLHSGTRDSETVSLRRGNCVGLDWWEDEEMEDSIGGALVMDTLCGAVLGTNEILCARAAAPGSTDLSRFPFTSYDINVCR
jgi:hypothetical protein